MRTFFKIIITLSFLYFLAGLIGMKFNFFTKEDYFAYAGIVGTLATISSLFALTRPVITKSDFQAIELETLKSVTETAEQLKLLQNARHKTAEEIDELALKKKEMELLVKKASLVLFLKEQYTHYEQQVFKEISNNSDLKSSLEKLAEVSKKLSALNEEIESDPNVNQLKEIIATASRKHLTLDEAADAMPPSVRVLFSILRLLS